VFFNLLFAKDTHDRASWDFLAIHTDSPASKDFPPDVPQITIFSTLPTRLVRLFDVQAGLERVAMRNFGTAVDG